jgi:PhoD-like phosphatase
MSDHEGAALVLGPVLRHVGHHDATIWVESDAPAEVEVLGHREPTFCVEGHHFALVTVRDLAEGAEVPYDVRFDGRHVWPPTGTVSTIRTLAKGRPLRLLAGSCRQVAPHDPKWNDTRGDGETIGPDALRAWAVAMRSGELPFPDVVVLVGDQVYADEQNAATERMLDERRGHPPRPGWPQVSSFQEYTWLYHDAWSDPVTAWLLSTVPSAMIFDDHDVIDDWNTSAAWREEIRREPWWQGRITGALMAYWLYQHLGNADRMDDHDVELLAKVRAEADGGAVLREWAHRADEGTPGTEGHRWSYSRDLGSVRLLVVDSRNGRQLDERGRSMLDDEEWAWLEDEATGGSNHVVVATSLPWLLPRSIHALEAWDERVAGGAWGRRMQRFGESLRRKVDLEHWAAFGSSFDRLAELVRSLASGERGAPPATITALSGDVHFTYVAEADLGEETHSRVLQVVTSPTRHAEPLAELAAQRLVMRPPFSWLPRALLRAAGRRLPFDWRIVDGPDFVNNVVLLTFDGPRLSIEVHAADVDDRGDAVLHRQCHRQL